MMRGLHAFVRFAERLSVILALTGAVSLGVAAGLTFVDVLLRPFGASIRGIVDLVQLFVISGVFLAMPHTFLSDGHVRVQIVLDQLSEGWRRGVLIAVSVLMLVFVAILAIRTHDGFMQVLERRDRSQAIAIPMIYYWGPMLIGLILSVPATLGLMLRQILRIGPERGATQQ